MPQAAGRYSSDDTGSAELARLGHLWGTAERRQPLIWLYAKRMNGLEPLTFCMARTRREVTGGDWSRHFAPLSGFLAVQGDTEGQQLTEKANPAS